jgi:hypothetical protein
MEKQPDVQFNPNQTLQDNPKDLFASKWEEQLRLDEKTPLQALGALGKFS